MNRAMVRNLLEADRPPPRCVSGSNLLQRRAAYEEIHDH